MSIRPKSLAIIILSWNDSKNTMQCVESVLDSLGMEHGTWNMEMMVIDNGSDDASPQELNLFVEAKNQENKNKNLKLSFSQNKENLGYAGGNNTGIRKALKNKAEYIFILNNDAVIEPDAIQKLLETAEQSSEIGIVGLIIMEHGAWNMEHENKNSPIKTTAYGLIRWLKPGLEHGTWPKARGFGPLGNMEHESWVIKHDEYVPGVAMLVKREVFKKIGPLDENYFLYFEDADFCMRAQKAGFKLKVVPQAKIIHKVSSSTSRLGSALLLRYHFRNALYFNKKMGPWWVGLLLWPWSWWIMAKQFIKILIRCNPEVSRAILAGVEDFYKKRMGKIN